MINKAILMGRLTRDPEIRHTNSGTPVCSFSIAINNGYGENQSTDFINCVAWNTQAKFISTYCKKGSLVALEGRLQTRSYDRKDGTKAYVTEVIADRVENLSPRDNTTANENNGYAINEAEDNQTLSYSDDDLPF